MEEQKINWQLPIGATVNGTGVRFRVWAKEANKVEVVICQDGQPQESYPLHRDGNDYYLGFIEGLQAGTRYMYRLDGDKLRPDPASRYQPESVHGPSEIVDSRAFPWQEPEDWQGYPLEALVIYEAHIGTATQSGTFEAFIDKLGYLKELGVTTLEIMPISDFPGNHNWGYDGADLFAPARAYGGPEGFKKLVEASHRHGLAVILDVVYNHLGPDGNYLRDFSREYFTDREKTPWGDAINYGCREVREFFIANALYWAHEYHVDGLRLDATHTILDHSEPHFLQELVARVRNSLPAGRNFVFIAEDERNEVKLIKLPQEGGYGLDAVWADDFHHEVRSSLAGDNEGYYADFTGKAEDIAETLRKGWFYMGQLSRFSGQPRGTNAAQIDPAHFVYCIQNHDQIGNRATGDRLTDNIPLDAYRAASALLLLSPYTPLLFQGQEWAASTPFLFFTNHNPELGKLVTEGRRAEFAHFAGFKGEQVPDPQALETFEASKLKWEEAEQDEHGQTLSLYRALLKLRCQQPFFQQRSRQYFDARPVDVDALAMRYELPESQEALLLLVNLKGDLHLQLTEQEITFPPAGCRWELLLSTNDPYYGGQDDMDVQHEAVAKGIIAANQPVALVLRSVSG